MLVRLWSPGNSHSLLGGGACNKVRPLWKTVSEFLTKQNLLSPRDPVITLLAIYPKELKTCPHETCTKMLIAALFMTVQYWKQLRHPSVGELINSGPTRQQLSYEPKKWHGRNLNACY